MCTSVNIRAVMAPAALNCPGIDWRPPSCPTPRKTEALFQVWPYRKTWFTSSLVQLDLFCHLVWWSLHGCGEILLSITNPCSGQGMAEWPMPHSSPASSQLFSCGSLIIVLGVLVVWSCLYIRHRPKMLCHCPPHLHRGEKSTTKCSWVRDRESSLTSYCHGQNRL